MILIKATSEEHWRWKLNLNGLRRGMHGEGVERMNVVTPQYLWGIVPGPAPASPPQIPKSTDGFYISPSYKMV